MYHELVYHLDLCILSYHLYTQTLLWPMDPYYEQMARPGSDRRNNFMDYVRARQPTRQPEYYCPNHLDPIVGDYQRLHPSRPCFVKPEPGASWYCFDAPEQITHRIKTLSMATMDGKIEKMSENLLEDHEITNAQSDHLYCFEGETGLVQNDNNPPQPGLKSMMGFVLDEQIDPSDGTKYNIHIVFRGSRSGWAVRAATQGLRDKGNPDWVTDMDSAIQTVSDDVISPEGKCCRGFCNSIKTIIPTIMISLDAIHQRRQNPPREIYVTGHSLGGALAAHFASAVSMGKKYSNLVQGYNREMPKDVQSWPWSSLKLITYGAPPVGDEDFHYGVNSKVYAKRIVLGNDVITQKRIRYHVGARTNLPSNNKLPNTEDHRPDLIREALIDWAKQWGDYLIGVPTDPPWTECSYFNDVLNHSAFRDDRNQVKLSLNGSFQDNLIEYLEIVREILGLDSSYKRGYAARKETKQKKQTSIQNLITEISNNSQGGNLDDVIATWKQILKDKKQNPIGERLTDFLGLCVVLHGFNIEPDKMDQSLRDNQALNEVITKKL